ncbi:hypothetical protein BD311DRAFT_457478 [Dichomitus squalens]|uniref:Uncharacterized protein n=1 Tax=Dichomitus squalens TaxID=114155 RepID=A0A4Q9MHW2_9APHY|nr:hypothetical protein BD311DRAFT_457478 [Dichomitus squalens]
MIPRIANRAMHTSFSGVNCFANVRTCNGPVSHERGWHVRGDCANIQTACPCRFDERYRKSSNRRSACRVIRSSAQPKAHPTVDCQGAEANAAIHPHALISCNKRNPSTYRRSPAVRSQELRHECHLRAGGAASSLDEVVGSCIACAAKDIRSRREVGPLPTTPFGDTYTRRSSGKGPAERHHILKGRYSSLPRTERLMMQRHELCW